MYSPSMTFARKVIPSRTMAAQNVANSCAVSNEIMLFMFGYSIGELHTYCKARRTARLSNPYAVRAVMLTATALAFLVRNPCAGNPTTGRLLLVFLQSMQDLHETSSL